MQFELSNLSPITTLKTDFIRNVSCVSRILIIALRASRGKITSKVACKIFAFYKFVEISITLSLLCFKSSSSRDFKKFPLKQSCKLTAYRNTIKNQLLTKFLSVLKAYWKGSLMGLLFSQFQA